MTYSALITLAILGDDFSRVNKRAVINNLRRLQNEDGSFRAVGFGSETDARFLFCAVAISFMLQDWSGFNIEKAKSFALSVQSHDGGIGLLPGQESHGGPTYCICAALALLGSLDEYPGRDYLERFLINRQIGGFNGRINKPPDTCYTFWVGGALQVLGMQDFIDPDSTREFLLRCEASKYGGGFSKVPDSFPDPLHAHFSICGFSLIKEPGFLPLISVLGMTSRAFQESPFCDGKCANGNVYTPKRSLALEE
uniref:Prenyltransferase alpha-alpha toroid domain-containing protein n=2 Tax=Aplanochytrium stocchinoi TaxID=215587 RepID=A0A7S3LNM3_9STRA|eukprot:CAMPEP_0204833566 /NCGR_PEP_ID=MMETSP1346-20131115/17072_1 /ASSEMBLY_ACC=CAM_ASM_000771 /TAXON_ID=215587 /ORGANISM="Aplanochytrium stocchinoi, Strain GSBS06" /LENGTH=252 /DNA_ID=CAMNT_0051966167 /DNA_START=1 /DNA_END=759 /DNA_ORIENTATION=-